MKMVITTFGNSVGILKFPDHYVTLAVTVDNAGIVANADGKKIVPAGTILTGKTTSALAGTDQYVIKNNTLIAEGVLFTDVDVTYGPAAGSMVIHGFLDLTKVTTAMGEAPSAAAIGNMKMIQFIK